MEKITIELDKNLDVAIYTIRGALTYSEFRSAVVDYYKGKLTKYTVWDFSESNLAEFITGIEAWDLASLVSRLSKARPGCYDLLIFSGTLQYGIARMYVTFLNIIEHDSPKPKTMLFSEKSQSMDWIRKNEGNNPPQ